MSVDQTLAAKTASDALCCSPDLQIDYAGIRLFEASLEHRLDRP